MPALAHNFDPRSVDPDVRPDPFPAGRYRFMILETDVVRTKAGDGSFLKVDHEVQGGPHNGRRFFNQITLENANPQAVEIGQRQLSALCHCVGYLQPLTNSDVLHGKSGEVEIDVDPASVGKDGKSYGPKNSVKRYVLPSDAKKPTLAASNGAAAEPAASSGRAKKPWE